MEKSQTAELLTIAAAIDPIPVTPLTVEAWHEVIGHLDYEEAREALRAHRSISSTRVLPVHIIEGARPKKKRRVFNDDDD